MRYFLLLALLYSVKSFAAYECKYDLYDIDDLKQSISSRIVTAHEKDMRSLFIHDLYTEEIKGRKKTSISLKVFIDGWLGEEEMAVAAFRDQSKNERSKLVLISEKTLLRGEDKAMMWFDSYKMDISCRFI